MIEAWVDNIGSRKKILRVVCVKRYSKGIDPGYMTGLYVYSQLRRIWA